MKSKSSIDYKHIFNMIILIILNIVFFYLMIIDGNIVFIIGFILFFIFTFGLLPAFYLYTDYELSERKIIITTISNHISIPYEEILYYEISNKISGSPAFSDNGILIYYGKEESFKYIYISPLNIDIFLKELNKKLYEKENVNETFFSTETEQVNFTHKK